MNENITKMLDLVDQSEEAMKRLLDVKYFDEINDDDSENLVSNLNILRGMIMAHVKD